MDIIICSWSYAFCFYLSRNQRIKNAGEATGEKRTLYIVGGVKIGTTTMKISIETSQKLKLEILSGPATPLPAIFPKS